jgi:hypothetical protein
MGAGSIGSVPAQVLEMLKNPKQLTLEVQGL